MSANTRIQSPLLPWPSEWGPQRPPAKLLLALGFFSLCVLIAIPYAIDFATHGDTLRAFYGVLGGVVAASFVLMLLPSLRVRRKSLPSNLHVGPSGLFIEVKSSWRPVLMLWLVIGAIFLVVRGALFVRHLSSDDDGVGSAIDVGGIVIVAVVLAMIAVLVVFLFGRHRRYNVVLSPGGISQGMGRTVRTMSWDQVGGVLPDIVNSAHTVRTYPTAGARVDVENGRGFLDRLQQGLLEQSIDVAAWTLALDPSLLLYLIRYYWQHPEARDELTSDAVVDRMRRGELLTGAAQ